MHLPRLSAQDPECPTYGRCALVSRSQLEEALEIRERRCEAFEPMVDETAIAQLEGRVGCQHQDSIAAAKSLVELLAVQIDLFEVAEHPTQDLPCSRDAEVKLGAQGHGLSRRGVES